MSAKRTLHPRERRVLAKARLMPVAIRKFLHLKGPEMRGRNNLILLL
jgi:hypothetical protein